MAWTDPDSNKVVAGDLGTADDWNETQDDLSYLHGDAGTVELADEILIPNNHGYRIKKADGTSVLVLTVDASDGLKLDPGLACASGVKVRGLAVQRRADGVDGHMERGTVTVTGGSSAAISFADAFASVPVVVATAQSGNNAPVSAGSVTTTGATIFNFRGGGSDAIGWIADGTD